MRTECAAAASTGAVLFSFILRRPLEAVVSKDEARAQAVQDAICDRPPPQGGRDRREQFFWLGSFDFNASRF